MTVHSLPLAVVDERLRRTRWGRLQALAILLVCAAPVLASYWVFYVARPSGGEAAYGSLVQPPVTMPDAVATDLQGTAVPLRSLKGQWLLVVVGSAGCSSACEQRLFLQRQLREMLGRERDRVDKVWLITDDGTPSAELQRALSTPPGVTMLRLPRTRVAGWLKPENGHGLDEHLYIVDPKGDWMMRMPPAPDPAKVRRDLERLLRASASWDAPGREPR